MNRLLKDTGGQVVVALAIIIPFIILQLAFLVNISLLVHQKVRLQNAIDAGSYSAAASFARDLNTIADLNFNIDQMWHGDDTTAPNLYISDWEQSFEDYLDDTAYNDVKMAKALRNKYENDYAAIMEMVENVSRSAFTKADIFGEMATRLTYYNGNETRAMDNPSRVTFASLHDSSTQGRGFIDWAEHTVTRSIPYVIDPDGCDIALAGCKGYSSLPATINTPINKLNHVAFVGKATAEPGFNPIARARYLVDPWMLTAFAKAQPYGGSVEGLSGTYGASLVPLGEVDGKTFHH